MVKSPGSFTLGSVECGCAADTRARHRAALPCWWWCARFPPGPLKDHAQTTQCVRESRPVAHRTVDHWSAAWSGASPVDRMVCAARL